MSSPATNAPAVDFAAAIEQQAAALEQLVAKALIIVCVPGAIVPYLAGQWFAPRGAIAGACATLAIAGYYAFVLVMLRAHRGAAWFRAINPFIEISIPAIGMLASAAASHAHEPSLFDDPWMFVYVVVLPLSVLRLRPFLPSVVGIVGAIEYGLLYVLLVRRFAPDLPPRADVIAVTRAVLIAMGGATATAIAIALDRAAIRAASDVRSRDLFGKYILGPLVASGGMGSVYRATYSPEGGFKRAVAVKRIHPHLATDETLVEAFRTEAALCARLVHPSIVQVFDFGRIEDTYFFAMEFVDGETLSQILRRVSRARARIPGGLCAYIGREVCRGLAYAHEVATDDDGKLLRVVHRDLNPPNVLVSRAGQVKILDFGIAKALGDAVAAQTGSRSGKLAYMAPEQVATDAIDERIDLFAAAITIWELLAARPLFRRDNDLATIKALMESRIPDIVTLRDDVAPEWTRFFALGLARNPTERFSSASAMVAMLDALLEREGVPHPGALSEFLRVLPEVGSVAEEAATTTDPPMDRAETRVA